MADAMQNRTVALTAMPTLLLTVNPPAAELCAYGNANDDGGGFRCVSVCQTAEPTLEPTWLEAMNVTDI